MRAEGASVLVFICVLPFAEAQFFLSSPVFADAFLRGFCAQPASLSL